MRIDAPPHIDGRLDDDAWSGVAPIDAFPQAHPIAGDAPSRRTELRFAHDGAVLYVAVRAFEPDAGRVVARALLRDTEAIAADDHVALVLDPQGRGRNGFVFLVNAMGAQRDGLVFDGAKARYEWDAVWDAAARIDADGWSAELAIPFAALAAPADGAGWRFNVERFIAAGSERLRLAGAVADRDVVSLADAVPLRGVVPDAVGLGVRLAPSLRWNVARRGDGSRRSRVEPGLDAFYQPHPGITAALTLNADFAEAEIDDRVVNLTRFALFVPEKRAFFTQDAGRFAFGGLDVDNPDLLPFFSRRIGVSPAGQALALDAGLKLAGSAGPLEFGGFAAQVERADEQARAPRIGVLRVATGLGDAHRLGMIATRGNPAGTRGSSLAGVDYQFRSTDFAGGRVLDAHAWAQESRNAGPGRGRAVGGRVDFPNIGFIANASWQRIDADFDPALGFVSETGVTRANGEVGWWHKTVSGGDVIPQLDWSLRRTLDGRERSILLNPEVYVANAAGDYLFSELFFERDRLAEPFELLPGVVLPAGEHDFRYAAAYAGTSTSRAWSADATLRAGSYYDGQRRDQALHVSWRPSAHWAWRGGFDRSDVDVGSGRFIVRNLSLRLDHAASTRSAQSVLLQWDNVSRQLGASLRARWTLAPGRDVLAALDRVRPAAATELQTVATLKLVWHLQR